ncbi:MOSC domain-containing protein [Naasia lichenicola]|uniref:MOSC domain-containing protein n=1 Tax=Naasia lichenicola TaxID=2565933 RepID=A0A4S4FKC1_9MICO|nr:MOSC domain-containing protein [Naasia lichenicola]THG30873.1 MOSC domain-containing protein [Naasia lichenicola]
MSEVERRIEIVMLHASPIHRYEGRPRAGALPAIGPELHEALRFRAGLGIVGDRHFNAPAHRRASVTLFAIESLERVAQALETPPLDPAATRRNVVVRGLDVDGLRGSDFSLDSGAGPVEFRAHRPCNPCAWMDVEVAEGAFRALRGRGGMRCEPLTDGTLDLGPAAFRPLAR